MEEVCFFSQKKRKNIDIQKTWTSYLRASLQKTRAALLKIRAGLQKTPPEIASQVMVKLDRFKKKKYAVSQTKMKIKWVNPAIVYSAQFSD